MKIAYKEKNFRQKSMGIIGTASSIIKEYQEQGFLLTLRQLYYQLVAKDHIPNEKQEYKRLVSIVNDARLAGLIDWRAIEDRTRERVGNQWWASPGHAMRHLIRRYQIDKWSNQENRLEVWIEKDALTGVIAGICSELDVDYFSCRGYTSASEMWKAGHDRFTTYQKRGQYVTVIHLGDHDPSGIDMTRDIEERLNMFSRNWVEVKRIALNWDQIELYNPPPNFAKLSDSRARGYIKEFGRESWELDALDPVTLAGLIEDAVMEYRDEDLWNEAKEREEADIEKLQAMMNGSAK